MTKAFLAAFSVLVCIPAAGQTSADLAKKYPHHEVYALEPGVQMAPKFDSTGRVCEMQVEQTRFVKDGVDLSYRIDERKAFSIIDGLVPVSERGAKLGTSEECMGVCQTTYQYSNVAISIVSCGGTRLVRIKWRNRSCS